MLGKYVGIFNKQPDLEKQAGTRDLSKTNLIEHKKRSIEFYLRFIDRPNISPKLQLDARKLLDNLLRLDQQSIIDPQEIAAKIIQFKVAAMATVTENPEEAHKSKNSANLTIC